MTIRLTSVNRMSLRREMAGWSRCLRTDWDLIPVEQRPEEAKVGYGYFLYQTESSDGGRTWSEPVRLELWGHPPYLLRLASGNILLVYGYRRAPWEIRVILSRDEGRTWDMSTLRTVHTFNPGNYDMGYPVATQLEDGSILSSSKARIEGTPGVITLDLSGFRSSPRM